MIDRVRKSFLGWWDGKYIPAENSPDDSVVFFRVSNTRHWTARFCSAVLEYARQNHRWIIGTMIALIALLIAARQHG